MFTELYREEKRKKVDRGGQEDKKEGIKRREREIQPVISSLSILHRLEHTGDSHSWVEKRRGREKTEVTWWTKRRVQRGESSQTSNLAPK